MDVRAPSTIAFTATLRSGKIELPINLQSTLAIKAPAGAEGIIEAFPFRAAFDPKTNSITFSAALLKALAVKTGETISVEITRVGDEPETRAPRDLLEALSSAPRAQTTWENTTPLARRDWILWILTGKQRDTRAIRIRKAVSMLASGKRRVCCFGGLNWLTKNHPNAETWTPLPS